MRPVLPAWLSLFLLLLWTGFALAAEPTYPNLTGRIVDDANLLNAEARARIEQKLEAHEKKTSDQVVVATLPSLQELTIEEFANGLFRHWQLGAKAKNNGVLLLVAPNERKVRIEVGYGLEGALTDALSKVIITTAVAPKFKSGDFAGGIEGGVDAILTTLTGDAEEWQRRAEIRGDESTLAEDIGIILVMLFIVLIIIVILRDVRRPRGKYRSIHRTRDGRWISLPQTGSSSSSSSSSGWSGGGGWSSGGSSSGGFSGGGGSSGGGGASGDW